MPLALSLRRVGLGLLVGAVLQPAGAQVRDTAAVKRDSSVVRDTSMTRPGVRRDSAVRRDTIKAALATAELPVLADPTGSFHWNRQNIFATGALSVQDLLDHVPGLTGLRANWIAQPMISAYLGDPRRVRVFLDGFALEELDPRMARIWDLSQIPLWALDDLVVERSASEVRIHLRSWRVDRTTPFTRTDIYTGDQATNLYRGLFGRRYKHGEVLQVAGQQFSTTPGRFSESSDQLGLLTRLGIARPKWTVDALVFRQSRHRGRSFTLTLSDTMPATESTRFDAYLRTAWNDTTSGVWAQALAGASTYDYAAPNLQGSSATSADSARSRSQYVLTGGYSRGPWRASFTQRFLLGAARHVATPSARFGLETSKLSVSLFAEGRGLDSTRRFDASAVARPVSFAFVAGSLGREQPLLDSAGTPSFARIEAGIRLGDLWVSLGALRRDPVELDATRIARRATALVRDSAAQGTFATIRGRLWKAVYVDLQGTRWGDTTATYRPQYLTRSEVYVNTSLLDRFPTGNFHVRASVVHEYRSSILWPDSSGAVRVSGNRTFSTNLQIRIVSAELFWHYRNMVNERYAEIPGYRLPRLSSLYGVRWEFWN